MQLSWSWPGGWVGGGCGGCYHKGREKKRMKTSLGRKRKESWQKAEERLGWSCDQVPAVGTAGLLGVESRGARINAKGGSRSWSPSKASGGTETDGSGTRDAQPSSAPGKWLGRIRKPLGNCSYHSPKSDNGTPLLLVKGLTICPDTSSLPGGATAGEPPALPGVTSPAPGSRE